jgi:hypothetical protein
MLAGDDAAESTGQTSMVDGGLVLRDMVDNVVSQRRRQADAPSSAR